MLGQVAVSSCKVLCERNAGMFGCPSNKQTTPVSAALRNGVVCVQCFSQSGLPLPTSPCRVAHILQETRKGRLPLLYHALPG